MRCEHGTADTFLCVFLLAENFLVVKQRVCSCNLCKTIKSGVDDEMHNLLKNMSMERLGKPLEAWLRRNPEFMKRRERYHKLLESLKKEWKDKRGSAEPVMRLDDAVGEYSGHYGETAYVLGFHDGLEIAENAGIDLCKKYGIICDYRVLIVAGDYVI